MVYLLKMVIFHGYVKLPEGSRNQTTTCNQNLNVLCNASYEKGAGWYFTSRPCERHTCNNWPPTLQESNSGQALCFRSPGVATLSPYWANTWFNKMFNKTRTHTQRCIVHRGRCKSLQVERVELNLQIAISTEGHWRSCFCKSEGRSHVLEWHWAYLQKLDLAIGLQWNAAWNTCPGRQTHVDGSYLSMISSLLVKKKNDPAQ